MPRSRSLTPLVLFTLTALAGPGARAAADCAATPQAAWALTQKAAKTRDLGAVLERLTPAGRGSAARSVAGGVVMHIGRLTVPARIEQAQAEAAGDAKAIQSAKEALSNAEKKASGPRRELDALLTRQRLPTLADLGEYPLERLSAPDIEARFAAAAVDHAAFVPAAWALLERLETAAKASGWEGGGGGVDEIAALAVGMGDLVKPLVDLKSKGDTASALNDDDARIDFRRLDGCWLIDGNQWIHD